MSTTDALSSTNLRLWTRLQRVPKGAWLFTRGLCLKAPYFRTIRPSVLALEVGYCRIGAPNRRAVHNHLGTFHAIAACNMAELAGGLMTDATVPNTHRWIPKGMTVEYRAKATTDLVAVASMDSIPNFGPDPTELVVPVRISNASGDVVVSADITMYVSPKRPSHPV